MYFYLLMNKDFIIIIIIIIIIISYEIERKLPYALFIAILSRDYKFTEEA